MLREITRCLGLMHDELESIRKELSLNDSDEFECSPILDVIDKVLAIDLLMGAWSSVYHTLDREVFLCLGYIQQILPDEEELICEEDVNDILSILSSLENQLNDSQLPEITKKSIKKQVENIYKALQSYKIVGVSSIQEAVNSVVGEIISNNGVYSEIKESEEVGLVKKLIITMNSVAAKVERSEKIVTSGAKLVGHGEKTLELLGKFI